MKTPYSSALAFLVHSQKISKAEARIHILQGNLQINGQPAQLKQAIDPSDTIHFLGQVIKSPQSFLYVLYHKPRGIECTLNTAIPDNLADALPFSDKLFPVGRLDKDSEGLLLLTNDGRMYNHITHSASDREKEYLVEVDKPLTDHALDALRNGVKIMGQLTRPALVTQISATSFRIILTQGLNRQIRRMCYKLGYEVLRLKRTRIHVLTLGALAPAHYRSLSSTEVKALYDSLT